MFALALESFHFINELSSCCKTFFEFARRFAPVFRSLRLSFESVLCDVSCIAFIGFGFVAEACDVMFDASGIGSVDGQVGLDELEYALILIASGGFANDVGRLLFSCPLDEELDAFFVIFEDGMFASGQVYGIELIFCDVDSDG